MLSVSQDNWTFGFGGNILKGFYMDAATILVMYITFRYPVPRRLYMKFGFDWPSGLRDDL